MGWLIEDGDDMAGKACGGKDRTRREGAVKIGNLDEHAMVIVTFRFFEDRF
jgi:hypothetical protein